MAYDEELVERVRELISARAEVSEKKMFGSLCFLIGGKLAVCVRKEELLVRIDPDEVDQALAEDGVRIAPMAGRRMKGWVLVGPERFQTPEDLTGWVDTGADYAASLPAKS
jgi:TfoX/Sxy family transcriptional regulator of competence genes